MIQRIQTIFLFLSGLCLLSLFWLPFATSEVAIPHLFSDMTYDVYDSPLLMGLTAIGALLSIIAIFLYNKRTTQLKLSNFTIVASVLIIVLAIILVLNDSQTTEGAETITESLGIGMPILSIIFSALASRFINKDEKTVRSMDRLR